MHACMQAGACRCGLSLASTHARALVLEPVGSRAPAVRPLKWSSGRPHSCGLLPAGVSRGTLTVLSDCVVRRERLGLQCRRRTRLGCGHSRRGLGRAIRFYVTSRRGLSHVAWCLAADAEGLPGGSASVGHTHVKRTAGERPGQEEHRKPTHHCATRSVDDATARALLATRAREASARRCFHSFQSTSSGNLR